MKEGLPQGWASAAIPELICSDGVFTDGDWVESKDQDPDGDVRLIQLADIGDAKFIDKSSRFLNSKRAAELNCTFLEKDDVLVARMPEPLGRACLFPLKKRNSFVTVVDVCAIRLRPEIMDPRFLMHLINSPETRNKIEEYKTGSTRKRISRGNLSKIALPIPPFDEQKRIVGKIEELFSELDKGIESLKTAREQLKVYRQAVLKHAFEGKLTSDWREGNASSLEDVQDTITRVDTPPRPNRWKTRSKDVILGHTALAVNNPGSTLPDGWLWVELVDVARMESGHTPSRKHPEWWEGDVKWIGIADARLRHGRVIADTKQHTNEDGLANSAARLLPKGTVCVSRTASVGYVVTMGAEMATSQDFVNWVPTEAVTSEWLNLIFSADRETLRRFGKGTTHKTIYYPEWMSVNIALPPISEQVKIVEAVNEIFSLIDKRDEILCDSLGKSEALRQSILKQAFSGKLVAQDPNDEPATVLLKRIKTEKVKNGKNRKGKAA